MEAEQRQEEEEEEGHPEGPFGKNPFQLTVEDVYDMSYLLGRELHQLSSQPGLEMPSRVAQLQFKVVAILEMLEALVNENNLAVEALRMERDSLKRELENLRQEEASGSPGEVNLGPNKMVIDLTDANRPRFTLQELREVLQERNQLKAQLLVAQEELQCYKCGFISPKKDWVEPTPREMAVGTTSSSGRGREEKTMIKRLFNFKRS